MRETYNIHVSVEPRHIVEGGMKSWYKDPIALAINDCLKPEFRAAVAKESPSVISIELHNYLQRHLCQYMVGMDKKSVEFTNKFDNSELVKPFTFVLTNVPSRMIKGLE